MKKFWLITILLAIPVASQCETLQVSGIVTHIVDATTFQIYCDNDTDGGGWITLLSRKDGSVDFTSPQWNDYAASGAGALGGEHFLALDYIYLLTKDGPKELLIEMRKGTDKAWAYFEEFQVQNAASLYKLKISGYDPVSTAGDGMTTYHNQKWSSPDNDNDLSGRNCAASLKSSWWFNNCHQSNPLGVYGADGEVWALSWIPFKGMRTALDAISFKIRNKRCQVNSGQSCLSCAPAYYLCTNKFSGRLDCCSTSIASCKEATATGVWDLLISGSKFRVWCNADFEGGGWTSILRRSDGSQDFSPTTWKDYAYIGAGNCKNEFIMSLYLMNLLTTASVVQLHVQLIKGMQEASAKYGHFQVSTAINNFKLSISQFESLSSGGDSLISKSNGATWSTPAVDTSGNSCPTNFQSSFWFTNCADTNPLGRYGSSSPNVGTFWSTFKGNASPLDYIEFLIRENTCQEGPSKSCTNCKNGKFICATKNEGTSCCDKPLSSCEEATYTGSYHILYKDTLMLVRCQVNGNETPWTTILRRYDGMVDFKTPLWNDYALNGVGNVGNEFFLALDWIHLLTQDGDMELIVEMQIGADSAFARYGLFMVEDQSTNYKLTVSDYDATSTGGDALNTHNGSAFSTLDRDNDNKAGGSCATQANAPFWFNDCYDTNPLGVYGTSVKWQRWKPVTLDKISFSIRRNLCKEGAGNSCTQCKPGYFLCTTSSGLLECCSHLLSSCEAVTITGIYEIGTQGNSHTVYCRIIPNYGVFTELLSRENGSVDDFAVVPFDDFAFKGHGSVAGRDYIQPLQFWHALSTSQDYELFVFAELGGTQSAALYKTFSISNYDKEYELTLGGYDALSTLNDDLSTANGNKFSAFDNDVTFSSCVSTNKMPFWNSNSCGNVNPLGVYGSAVSKQGIYWDSLTGCCSSLTQISFAVRLSHCTAGSGLACSACESNFYLNTFNSKSVCTSFCDTSICSQCNLSNPLVCEGECADGYYLDTSTQSCQECHTLCNKCSTSSTSPCSECAPGAYFLEDSCHYTCPPQYYALPTNECTLCPFSNCQQCTAAACTLCEDGFYMHSGSCVAQCPDPFYSDDITKTCLSCSSGCSSCFGPSLHECFTCDSSTHSFTEPSSCVNFCNIGLYYDSSLLSCQPCHSTCTLCYGPSQDQCTACISGRLLQQNSCAICEDSPGLMTDPADSTQCLQICGDGLFYGINQCDDANLLNGDGCNSICQVQTDYYCQYDASCGYSVCFHSLFPYIKSATVDPGLMLTLYFSEPLTLIMNLTQTDFNFTIIGPYSYSFSLYMDSPSTSPFTTITGQLIIESNLYGNSTEFLELEILNMDNFKDLDGNSLRTCWASAELPQYEYYTQAELMAIETAVQAFSTTSYKGVIVDFSIFFCIVIFSGVMWSLANTVQLMSFLPLANVFLPYNFKELFRILGFINMDIQIVQSGLQDYFFGSEKIMSEPYNQRYEQIRFESKLLTYNVSVLLALWLFMVSMLPLFVVIRCLLPLPRIQKCTLKIIQSYKYNTFLILLVQSFLELYMSAILNLFSVSIVYIQLSFNTPSQAASSLLSMFFFFILSWLPLLLHKILSVPIIQLRSDKFKQEFGALITDLNIEGEGRASVVQFFSIFIFRRMAFILILVFLCKYPRAQLILLVIQSFMMLLYLIKAKPFKNSKKMKLEILNQCLLLLCIICLCTLYFRKVYLHAKYVGWLAVLIASTCIFINILCILPYDIRHFCKRCKERCSSKETKRKIFKVKLSQLKLAWNKTENEAISELSPRRGGSSKVLIYPQRMFREARTTQRQMHQQHERRISLQLESQPPLEPVGTRNMLYL